MAIIKVDPPNWEQFNVVQVDSDLPTNKDAMFEIDAWAYNKGFARTPEYWLRMIYSAGKRVYRGVCYRLTEEEQASSEQLGQEIANTAARIPRTVGEYD